MLRGAKPPLATRPPVTPRATKALPGSDSGSPGELPTNTPSDLSMYLPSPTPLALPDYPVPTPTTLPAYGPNGFPPDPSSVTRLIIPRMNLDAVVKFVPYNGDTWLIGGLKQEVAWMGDTSWPGLGSNTGLAGHVDLADGSEGPFWNLSNLAPGDTVKLYTEKNLYTYAVRSQEIVDDHDLSVVDPSNDPQLTLITCTGWDPEFQVYLQRLIVYAALQGVQPLAQGNQ
jgi:sortase A